LKFWGYLDTSGAKPSHWICKPAYLVPVPSQDKLGGLCKEGTLRKNGGDGRGWGTN